MALVDHISRRIFDYARSVADDLAQLKLDQIPLAEVAPGFDKGAVRALERRIRLTQPLSVVLRDEAAIESLEMGVGADRALGFIAHLRKEAGKPRGWPETRLALEAWARNAGVEHLLQRTAKPVNHWDHGVQLSVADVFDDAIWEVPAHHNYGLSSKRAARQNVWAMLLEEAGALDAARRNAVPPWPAPPGQARRTMEKLEALRAPSLARWPRNGEPPGERLDVLAPEGIARLELPNEVNPLTRRAFTPRVTISLRSDDEPSCSCELTGCWHIPAALDRFAREVSVDTYYGKRLSVAAAPTWGHVLLELEQKPATAPAAKFAGFRLKLDHHVWIDPLEVGENAKKPRKATAQSLLDDCDTLSKQERSVLELIATQQRGRSEGLELMVEALWALRGHPAVVLKSQELGEQKREQPVKVMGCEPAMTFVETPAGLALRWKAGEQLFDELPVLGNLPCFNGDRIYPVPRPGALWLLRLSADAAAFEEACERHGRAFPPESHHDLLQALGAMRRVSTELPPKLRGEELKAPLAFWVRAVFGAGPQLDLSLHLKPLGPPLTPGAGAVEVSEWRSGGRVYCRRDLDAEREQANTLSTRLALPHDESFTWRLTDVDQVLETAARLAEVAREGVTVEFPAEMLSVTRPAKTKDLKLRLMAKGAWFKLDGKASFDGVEVPLQKVIDAIRGGQRWVELSAGKLARLSEELAQALAPVALSSKADDELELTLPQVAALSAAEAEFGELEAAAAVKKLLEQMQGASDEKPKLPKGFKAELREYQREGFEWMSRLAQWAPGAVLADDMGLGKTVQALALLASRAKRGPQLVVAPTSVTQNWLNEAGRFAPSLKLSLLRDGERSTAIAQAQAGEVLVASWTLMAKEIEALAQRDFATVVLDEAQAIKNAGTQRAQAARRLKAGFTLALTGTPLENHLGELWSLFRAVSPGLFGSEEQFKGRYWGRIEGENVREKALAWTSLRALVKPFLLRRRKDEVATELPKKTEITRLVALTPKEAGVYEAARRQALETLEHAVDQQGEDARFHVLAALTRLRQLSCHVGLVDETWSEGSSKLSALVELLTELKEEGHRVLVFSQFTTLLAKTKEAVTAAGLKWLLLQGDTPAAERQLRVDAFQRGEADVFLLSLKAGGTGLNLTAADYVVHLDPWWNPAVEDQASDRAHRIGQTRPVTIYRLVSQGTIEEKILSLHGKKRELVESVLEGTQAASKLTAKELVELLSQG
ncbi:MAG: DEAD/DEAH box helicase [Myxococcaceae bacterium]